MTTVLSSSAFPETGSEWRLQERKTACFIRWRAGGPSLSRNRPRSPLARLGTASPSSFLSKRGPSLEGEAALSRVLRRLRHAVHPRGEVREKDQYAVRRRAWVCLALLLMPWNARATEWVVGKAEDGGWRLADSRGIQVETPQTVGEQTGVGFVKTGDERRLLAFEAPLVCDGQIVSANCPHSILLERGTARLTLVAYEKDGDTWFKQTGSAYPSTYETGMSLAEMTRASFCVGEGKDIDWEQVHRIAVGLVLEGCARGSFALRPARLSDQAYRASQPFTLKAPASRQWQHAADPAANVRLTTPSEGPEGASCWRFDFAFPGGRHMFAVPTTPIEDVEVSAYQALEIEYTAQLPEGIPGLLLMLIEHDGTQYFAEPTPPPSGEWKQLSVPFENFRRGGWSKDENDRLDLDGVASIAVGVHGVAKPTRAEGTVRVSRLRLLPWERSRSDYQCGSAEWK